MQGLQKGLDETLRRTRIVPVLVIDDVKQAVPLARSLAKGGLRVLEITLRTAAAADCIHAIRAEIEDVVVGSGTVIDEKQLDLSEKLGCVFAVSPGATQALIASARGRNIALLPGSASASEAMNLLECGYRIQKFFPAEPAGGTAYLSSLSSPLPQVKFCPTGGLTQDNAASYLKLSNVIAVGGSWMAPKRLVSEAAWREITRLAHAAAGFGAAGA